MKRLTLAAVCALMLAVAAPSAHNEYRIIGTVIKVTAKTLDVKQTKDGKIISIGIDGETIVMRDKKKVDRAELTTGLSVVVDACGDSLKDLVAVEVRLVPAPTTSVL